MLRFLDPLKFVPTPWSIAASLVGVLVTGIYCAAAWHRSGYRRSVGLLELLRLTIVCFCAVLLNQPEWIKEYRPEEKPSIAVLWDASTSMETRDCLPAGQTSSLQVTRHEAIAPLTDPGAWKQLEEKMSVVIDSFSPQAPARGSDL